MSRYVEKLGLWEHEGVTTCASCGAEADFGWSDEENDEPVGACDIQHWAAYWDARVRPVAGRKLPKYRDFNMDTWAQKVGIVAQKRNVTPGLVHLPGKKMDEIHFYLADGKLGGILYHFPLSTLDGRRQPGHIAVWVFPAYQGQGIGSKLGCAAARRYGIDLGIQSWSKQGAIMATRAFRGHPLASAYRGDNGSN